MVALIDGGCLGAAGVRACVRLSQSKGADFLAPAEGNQIFFLLLFRTEGKNRPGAQGNMGGENNACASVYAGKLFYGNGVADHVQSGAAVLLRIRDSHETHLA